MAARLTGKRSARKRAHFVWRGLVGEAVYSLHAARWPATRPGRKPYDLGAAIIVGGEESSLHTNADERRQNHQTGEVRQVHQLSEYKGIRVMRTTQSILEMVHASTSIHSGTYDGRKVA